MDVRHNSNTMMFLERLVLSSTVVFCCKCLMIDSSTGTLVKSDSTSKLHFRCKPLSSNHFDKMLGLCAYQGANDGYLMFGHLVGR